ncbi:hypothetical protein IDH15_00220 [Pelagibacterales bacterium SAG-MED38]|nr:hypothetical protein [Pelagibacterales bacterium SAG-MED38]
MKKIIYIVIEIARRELDSKILLALKAKEKNFDVAITKKSRLFSVLKYLKSGIIFLKSFGPRYNPILKNVKSNGHKLVGMDEEGAQISFEEHLIGRLRFSTMVFRKLEYLFTWGLNSKKIYSKFLKRNNLDVKKIISTGSPRIDILKKSYNKIFFYKPKTLYKKNFILIATQFLKYNGSDNKFFEFDKLKFNSSIMKEHKNNNFSKGKNFKYELNEFARNFEYQKNNFLLYDKMYKYLSKKFPNELFVIKPHPGEGLIYYKNLEKKLNNFKIITEDVNIHNWIKASKLLISCNCTTAIEAQLLGTPSINYIPYKDVKTEFKLSKLMSINLRKKFDLSNIIKNKKYMNFKIKPKSLKGILYHLENFNDKDGSDTILNYLQNVDINYKNYVNKYSNFIFRIFLILKARYHSFLGSFDQARNSNQKLKRQKFNLDYLNERLNIIQKVLFKKKKYKFKENFFGIYYLEKI